MTETPTTEPRSHGGKDFLPAVILIARGMLLLACLVTSFLAIQFQRERNSARAEVADLKTKLAEQTSGQTACLKENLNLISWKVEAQSMMLEAADMLRECSSRLPDDPKPRKAKPARPASAPSWPTSSAETSAPVSMPGRKFPRRRKIDLDDSFVGAEVFPPQ